MAFWRWCGRLCLRTGLPQAAAACARVLAAAILCALFRAGDEGLRTPTADILGAVAIASLLLQPTDALIQSGLETVQAISDYGKLLLPVMSAALVASGGTTTASALYIAGTAMFDSLLTGLLAGLLGPLMYCFYPCLWLPPPLETSFWDGCGTFSKLSLPGL